MIFGGLVLGVMNKTSWVDRDLLTRNLVIDVKRIQGDWEFWVS